MLAVVVLLTVLNSGITANKATSRTHILNRNERQVDNLRNLFDVSKRRNQYQGFQKKLSSLQGVSPEPPSTGEPEEKDSRRDIYSLARERYLSGNILDRTRSRFNSDSSSSRTTPRPEEPRSFSRSDLFKQRLSSLQRTDSFPQFNRRGYQRPGQSQQTSSGFRGRTSQLEASLGYGGRNSQPETSLGYSGGRNGQLEAAAECQSLRTENQLLREMLEEMKREEELGDSPLRQLHKQQENTESLSPLELLYRNSDQIQTAQPQVPNYDQIVNLLPTPRLQYSTFTVETSYETTLTVDVTREISVLLNGRKITTSVLGMDTTVSLITETLTSTVEITPTPTLLFNPSLLLPTTTSNPFLVGLSTPNLLSSRNLGQSDFQNKGLDSFQSLQQILTKLKERALLKNLEQRQKNLAAEEMEENSDAEKQLKIQQQQLKQEEEKLQHIQQQQEDQIKEQEDQIKKQIREQQEQIQEQQRQSEARINEQILGQHQPRPAQLLIKQAIKEQLKNNGVQSVSTVTTSFSSSSTSVVSSSSEAKPATQPETTVADSSQSPTTVEVETETSPPISESYELSVVFPATEDKSETSSPSPPPPTTSTTEQEQETSSETRSFDFFLSSTTESLASFLATLSNIAPVYSPSEDSTKSTTSTQPSTPSTTESTSPSSFATESSTVDGSTPEATTESLNSDSTAAMYTEVTNPTVTDDENEPTPTLEPSLVLPDSLAESSSPSDTSTSLVTVFISGSEPGEFTTSISTVTAQGDEGIREKRSIQPSRVEYLPFGQPSLVEFPPFGQPSQPELQLEDLWENTIAGSGAATELPETDTYQHLINLLSSIDPAAESQLIGMVCGMFTTVTVTVTEYISTISS